MLIDEDFVLEHYGTKGMKWGQRLARKQLSGPAAKAGYKLGKNINTKRENIKTRKASFKEVKEANKSYASKLKEASKDPTFKREVAATRKRKGIDVTNAKLETTPIGGLLTSRMMGNFKNSKGEKVSEEFANAVLKKAVQQKDRQRIAATGAIVVAAMIGGRYLGKQSMRR